MSDWPKMGSRVRSRVSGDEGTVKGLYLMRGKVRVHFDGDPDSVVLFRGELEWDAPSTH